MKLIKLTERDKHGKKKAIYKCFCGNEKEMLVSNVSRGLSKSCGCVKRKKSGDRLRSHGMTRSSEYASWQAMKVRCLNKNSKNYNLYGGRGITICDRWVNSFENFLADMGFKPDKSYTIDRINNDKGYSASNCRWSSRLTQTRNRSVSVLFKGELSSEASRRLGGSIGLVSQRIKLGWNIEDAFSLPKGSKKTK
jgi:hypothetical protein